MEKNSIYEDIAARTGGDVYLGVVGPVRTGKSTFIKRFMETLVIPEISSDYIRERAKDELPQSGSGRTIMTAEPKFVPEEAVKIAVNGGAELSVRLIDCVGYMVEGAMGSAEDGAERMVTTPWFEREVPMRVAAETGTRKVIAEHSTIGVVVTTDGSVTEFPRESYVQPEERVIRELRELGKPFVVLLNSAHPDSPETVALAAEIGERNGAACVPVNAMLMTREDIGGILETVLGEFPVREYRIWFPAWVEALASDHPIKAGLYSSVRQSLSDAELVKDSAHAAENIGADTELTAAVTAMSLGDGTVSITVEAPQSLFYRTAGELSGFEIADDGDLMALLGDLASMRREYEKVSDALREVRETGYGVVMPTREDLKLMEPEIVRRGGRYSVRMKATAPTIHMIMTDVETEVAPQMGGERSSSDVISFLLQEFEGDTGRIWESNIFGRSLHDIAGDSIGTKIRSLPPETREKLRGSLTRIINDGAEGLICILL